MERYTFGQPITEVTTVELMKRQIAEEQHEINMLRKRVKELIDENNDLRSRLSATDNVSG